jgi:hypothetical protein
VAAALVEIRRQLLVLDMARAWALGDCRYSGAVGEQVFEDTYRIDATIADTLRFGLLAVRAAASATGAALVPCFAPAYIAHVRALHYHTMVPVPFPAPPDPRPRGRGRRGGCRPSTCARLQHT